MPGNIYKRGRTYWGRIQHQGNEYRRSLQTTSRTVAEDRAAKWIAEMKAQAWGERQIPTFEDAAVHFFAVSGDLKPATLRRYQSSLRLLDPFMRGKRLDEINRETLREFVAYRRREVATATIRRDLAFLSVVFAEAIEHWGFDGNPVLSFMRAGRKRGTLRDSEPRTRYLSADEERALLAVCEPSLHFAVCFAIDTGLRREEQFGLRWSDIDMQNGIVTVEGARTKKHRTRRVPIQDRTAQILAHQPRRLRPAGEPDFVFCKPDGERYQHRRRAYETAVKRSGIPDLTWHDLRTTCGCRLLQDHEMSMDKVREWLGHSSVAVTERHYAFLSVDDLKKSLAQNPAQEQRFTK